MYRQSTADSCFLKQNYETAAAMYREGARDGDERAAFNYAYCLERGYGVPQDYREAKSYYSYARDMHGGEACYNLSMLYLHGNGFTQDFVRAFSYMRESADRGCLEAQLYLGMLYTTGCMFEPDVIRICMIPFHKAEEREFLAGYLDGSLTDPEEEEDKRFSVADADPRCAFEWFRTAALQNSVYTEKLIAKAKFLYAKCFLDGFGTEFNRERGERIMLLAGQSGSGEAIEFLTQNGYTVKRLESVIDSANKDQKCKQKY